MYQRDENVRGVQRSGEGAAPAPEVKVRHAVGRVRQALSGEATLPASQLVSLRAGLAKPVGDARLEAERLFALGWLHWLAGDNAAAAAPLAAARDLPGIDPAERATAAYWLARARLLDGHPEAVGEFERLMRTFQGSPQATCFFVDLLWRMGRDDRAHQIWKAVRVNKKVAACEEAPLLEARLLPRQADAAAEKTLREAAPKGGVLRAERALLLAWVLGSRHQPAEVGPLLDEARSAVYPAAALDAWASLWRLRTEEGTGAPFAELLAIPLSAAARALVLVQQARAGAGEGGEAVGLPRAVAALRPFARYALACRGAEDFTALLADLPGSFLAPRCRLWQTLGRFCRREIEAPEVLGVLEQAIAVRHGVVGLADWIELARLLADPQTPPSELWSSQPRAVNRRRAAVERTLRLPPADAMAALLSWGGEDLVVEDAPLRQFAGRHILRLCLKGPPADLAEATEAAGRLLGSSALPDLVGALHDPTGVGNSPAPEGTVAAASLRLWRAAVRLARQEDDWQQDLEEPGVGRAGALAQALRVVATARAGDAVTVARLLEPAFWRALSGPPALVCDALAAVDARHLPPGQWSQTVGAWLRNWEPQKLGAAGGRLALKVGAVSPVPEESAPPPGVDGPGWFLHQASLALSRDEEEQALAWVRCALAEADRAGTPPERLQAIRDALPELERRAQCGRLADLARCHPTHVRLPAALFADMRDLLLDFPEGRAVLEGDRAGARGRLLELAGRPDLPPRLAHHLALVYTRAARLFEEQDRPANDACWVVAWPAWLTWARGETGDGPALVIDHLLGLHRDRLRHLLGRNEVDRARRLWDLVTSLARLAPDEPAGLKRLLHERLAAFRDGLATDYLLETREEMRAGDIPEGWRADYEAGLARLRRLLSLDRDNPALLTALLEICGDWFLDLYNTQEVEQMRAEADRYSPFAAQLARVGLKPGEGWSGELAARAALAEFYKFRGYLAESPDRKIALYREALAFNPANDNVRRLLAELEGPP